jgi:hypothetical protein
MTHTRKLILFDRRLKREVECMVELDLDLDHIAEILGSKAIGNKSKRSRALGGMIKANVRLTQAERIKFPA